MFDSSHSHCTTCAAAQLKYRVELVVACVSVSRGATCPGCGSGAAGVTRFTVRFMVGARVRVCLAFVGEASSWPLGRRSGREARRRTNLSGVFLQRPARFVYARASGVYRGLRPVERQPVRGKRNSGVFCQPVRPPDAGPGVAGAALSRLFRCVTKIREQRAGVCGGVRVFFRSEETGRWPS